MCFPIYAFRHEHDNPSCNDIEIFEKFGRQMPISMRDANHWILLATEYFYAFSTDFTMAILTSRRKNERIIKIRIDEIEWRSELDQLDPISTRIKSALC